MKIEIDINAEDAINQMLDSGGLKVDTLIEFIVSDPFWVKENISEGSKIDLKKLASDL